MMRKSSLFRCCSCWLSLSGAIAAPAFISVHNKKCCVFLKCVKSLSKFFLGHSAASFPQALKFHRRDLLQLSLPLTYHFLARVVLKLLGCCGTYWFSATGLLQPLKLAQKMFFDDYFCKYYKKKPHVFEPYKINSSVLYQAVELFTGFQLDLHCIFQLDKVMSVEHSVEV